MTDTAFSRQESLKAAEQAEIEANGCLTEPDWKEVISAERPMLRHNPIQA